MRLSPTKLESDLAEKAEKSAQMQAGSIFQDIIDKTQNVEVVKKQFFQFFPFSECLPRVCSETKLEKLKNWKHCFLRRSWGVYIVCEKAVF